MTQWYVLQLYGVLDGAVVLKLKILLTGGTLCTLHNEWDLSKVLPIFILLHTHIECKLTFMGK